MTRQSGNPPRPDLKNRSLLRKPELPCCLLEQFHDIETAIESFTASSPMELPAPAAPPPGAIGTDLTRRKWPLFSPPLTLHPLGDLQDMVGGNIPQHLMCAAGPAN